MQYLALMGDIDKSAPKAARVLCMNRSFSFNEDSQHRLFTTLNLLAKNQSSFGDGTIGESAYQVVTKFVASRTCRLASNVKPFEDEFCQFSPTTRARVGLKPNMLMLEQLEGQQLRMRRHRYLINALQSTRHKMNARLTSAV